MIFVENIYICLAAPLLLAIFLTSKEWQGTLIALFSGMTSCLLSGYINAFCMAVLDLDEDSAIYQINPAIEEIMKFLPVVFYLVIFEPKVKDIVNKILIISIGFATFENVCYLTGNGTDDLVKLIIRGLGTGAMHVVCGMMLAVGISLIWEQEWLRAIGILAVLCPAITFHAIFNIMVSHQGVSLFCGSAIPLIMIDIYLFFFKKE